MVDNSATSDNAVATIERAHDACRAELVTPLAAGGATRPAGRERRLRPGTSPGALLTWAYPSSDRTFRERPTGRPGPMSRCLPAVVVCWRSAVGSKLCGMRTTRALVPLLLLGLALGACGGGPSPAAWAASVCAALTPWRSEIGSLTERAQSQMDAATTPAQAKENLTRLLAGAEAASEAARSRVEAAGVPDVDGGGEVARSFVASLTAARDAYGRARTAVAGLDTGDAKAFYDGVTAAMTTLTEEYGRSALDTGKLRSAELQRAFGEVPECR